MTREPEPLDTSTPAVVLKFDPNVMHHGGLGAIRSLGRLGAPVYGVHESRWAPAARSRYLSGRTVWTPDPERAEQTLAGLRRLAGRIGRPAVLVPTDDAGAIFLAEHGDGLREEFLFARPPADLPRRVAGKHSLHTLCRELGVASPWTVLPDSPGQAREFGAAAGYPVVAKLAAPWRAAGTGLRSTTIVGSQAELERLLRDCGESGYAAGAAAGSGAGLGLMLQELIPAGPGDDWFVHGYRGEERGPVFTGVKDRSYPAHAGLTSRGHAVANETLREQAAKLIDAVSYRGVFDLDLRRDARTGQYVLLDFNPRLGAQFRVFADRSGFDVVRAAYADLTGQRRPVGPQVDGRAFLVENYDPLGALAYWRSGELGLRAWLASLRGVDETAWLARDDLRPFGLMCARMGWRAVSRPLARRRRPARATQRPTRRSIPGPTPGSRQGWGADEGLPTGRLAETHRGK